MIPAQDTSTSLDSSHANAPILSKQLPDLEDLDELEATYAISMYLDMVKDSGDNQCGDMQLSTSQSTNSSQIFQGHKCSSHLGKSVRKKLQFQDIADSENVEIVPNFDLGLEWDDDCLSTPTSCRNNSDQVINLEDYNLPANFDSFDDSFDEAIHQQSCDPIQDDDSMAVVKKRSKLNSSCTPFTDTPIDRCSMIADDSVESFCDYKFTESGNNGTQSFSFNSGEINLTETPNKNGYFEIGKSSDTDSTDTWTNGQLASVMRDVHNKEETKNMDAIPTVHYVGKHQANGVTSFYENRAKKRALMKHAKPNGYMSSIAGHSGSNPGKDRAPSSCKDVQKPLKKASDCELAKANDLLNNILDFFDL